MADTMCAGQACTPALCVLAPLVPASTTTPPKRKRGRPPKNRPRLEVEAVPVLVPTFEVTPAGDEPRREGDSSEGGDDEGDPMALPPAEGEGGLDSPQGSTARRMGSRVRRDRDRAQRAGHLMMPVRNRLGTVWFRGYQMVEEDYPTGMNYFPAIVTRDEHERIVAVTNTVPRQKRSPWSTEGLGGKYQKVYFLSDNNIDTILKHGYTWNQRRMKFQTVHNPEDAEHPGAVRLQADPNREWPAETLTDRVGRLAAVKTGRCLELVGMQANWMMGTDFPTHKDLPSKEGWGDVIACLSLCSGGDVVLRNPVTDEAWCMYIGPRDMYTLRDNVRWEWEHGLVADDSTKRISLVWRFREYDPAIPLHLQPARTACT